MKKRFKMKRKIIITIQSASDELKNKTGKSVTQYLLAHFLLNRGHKVSLAGELVSSPKAYERMMPTEAFHMHLEPMDIEIRTSRDEPDKLQESIECSVQGGLLPQCGPFGGRLGFLLFGVKNCLLHPIRTLQRTLNALKPVESDLPEYLRSQVRLRHHGTFLRFSSGSYYGPDGSILANVKAQTLPPRAASVSQ